MFHHRLNRLPDLKFKYVEEEEPEEFFIPYVWTLATQVFFRNYRFFCVKLICLTNILSADALEWGEHEIIFHLRRKPCDKNLHSQALS